MSEEHLLHILNDKKLIQQFATFINKDKPQYAPTFVQYLATRKAQKAVGYANLVSHSKRDSPLAMKRSTAAAIFDSKLGKRARRDIEILRSEVLSSFVVHELVHFVTHTSEADVRRGGSLSRDCSSGLGKKIGVTDPCAEDTSVLYAPQSKFFILSSAEYRLCG